MTNFLSNCSSIFGFRFLIKIKIKEARANHEMEILLQSSDWDLILKFCSAIVLTYIRMGFRETLFSTELSFWINLLIHFLFCVVWISMHFSGRLHVIICNLRECLKSKTDCSAYIYGLTHWNSIKLLDISFLLFSFERSLLNWR